MSEQRQVLQQVDVNEVKSAFMASGDNLFHFVMNYSGYRKPMTDEEKLVIFCQITAQRLATWTDRLDFLKTFNNAFGSGFSFRKSSIVEKFSSDIELKEKAAHIYTDVKTNEEKTEKLIADLDRQGFVELENELDGTYKVTAAFHYIEELIDCLTIIETKQE